MLQEVRGSIRKAAAEHIVIREADSEIKFDATRAFICPPLSDRKFPGQTNKGGKPADDTILLDDLLVADQNYLFVGNRESGKSSLAHYIAVQIAEGRIDKPRIPIVVDYRKLKRNDYGLRMAIASYLGPLKNGLDAIDLLETGAFIFLIDNFSGLDKKQRKLFVELIQSNANNRWFLFSDSRIGGQDPDSEDSDLLPGFTAINIRSLPRRSIRELANRWCDITGSDKEKTFAAVMNQVRRGNLPRTGYIVTLLLWALYQERRFERINEAVLLTNISDYLLGKADFTQALRREFDPTSKEITLQHIAVFLRDRDDFATANETIEFLVKFFKQKGLAYDAADVLEKLISCGILSKNSGEISFKYRCFQDYFYASHLRNDEQALKKCLDHEYMLEFSRELDLLSGLRRTNYDIISVISTSLVDKVPSDVEQLTFADFDIIARQESDLGVPRKKLEDIKKKKITSEQIDDLIDATERRVAKRRNQKQAGQKTETSEIKHLKGPNNNEPDTTSTETERQNASSNTLDVEDDSAAHNQSPATIRLTPSSYIRAVDLLGRVVRNSEFADANVKIEATRLYALSSARIFLIQSRIVTDLVAALIETENKESPKFTESDLNIIGYMMNKIMLTGVTEMMSEQIGTEKLFSIFDEIIDDQHTSYSEKFFIVMLLLDLRHHEWEKKWLDLISTSKSYRFILDVMVDKIWRHIHTRPLNDKERSTIVKVTERLERALGTKNVEKSHLMNVIRQTATIEHYKDRSTKSND